MSTPDPDIETSDALRLLSAAPAAGTTAWSRRRFLQLVGMGLGAGLTGSALVDAIGSGLPGFSPDAFAAPVGPNDGILVVVGMYGGNDGLNTVVPIADGNYYTQHGPLAIPAAETLPLTAGRGLNPRLATLHRMWQAGQVAIVEGVGYPDPDLSHFTSMAIWMSAIRHGIPSTGWLGRWLDAHLAGGPDLYAAAAIGSSVPLHLIGAQRRASAIPPGGTPFGAGTGDPDKRAYDAIRAMAAPAGRGVWHDALSATLRDLVDLAARLRTVVPSSVPAGLEGKLEVAARLVNADLGFRVLEASWGDFDSHSRQPTMHADRMVELDAAIARFFATLDPRWSTRVTVMTFSEFGRTSWSNDSAGTDHGTASCAMVVGANVAGGLYGQHPNLAGLRRWDRQAFHVDLRSYYTSVIAGWLGGDAAAVLGGTFEDLHLFRRGPGIAPPVPPPAPSPAPPPSSPPVGSPPPSTLSGAVVPVSPMRAADTRTGWGGVPARPVGPGERITVKVTGLGAVPVIGVTAVLVNLTGVGPSVSTYLTACPSSAPLPPTSNLNPVPGRATPNLALVGVGPDGCIDVVNALGQVHCLVDVLGYVHATAGDCITTVEPARILDTRLGLGAPAGRVSLVELDVWGRGGVPTGASGVVLNVTVTGTERAGFATVGPSGEPVPPTSNLNFDRGDTVANLAVCKIGADGRVRITVDGGPCDLIADVTAYVRSGGGTLRVSPAARVLDTRLGLGAPIGRTTAAAPVRVATGAPAGATGVVLNLTAVEATEPTFVTVWPGGSARPATSNVNLAPNSVVANLVVCRLGPGGTVDVAPGPGAAHLIADVAGFVIG